MEGVVKSTQILCQGFADHIHAQNQWSIWGDARLYTLERSARFCHIFQMLVQLGLPYSNFMQYFSFVTLLDDFNVIITHEAHLSEVVQT